MAVLLLRRWVGWAMVLAFVLGRVAAAADAQQQLSRAAQSGDVARVSMS